MAHNESYIEISNKQDDIIQFYTTKISEILPTKQNKRKSNGIHHRRNSDIVVDKQNKTTTNNDKLSALKQIAKLNKTIKTKTAKIELLINQKNDIINEKNKIILKYLK